EGEHAEALHEPVQDLGAEHRALVVDEREDHRPPTEVVAEPHSGPALVAKGKVERQRRIQMLLEPDTPKAWRATVVGTAGPTEQGEEDESGDEASVGAGASSQRLSSRHARSTVDARAAGESRSGDDAPAPTHGFATCPPHRAPS